MREKTPSYQGKLIKILRKAKGLTLRELARKSGLSNAFLCQIETGHVRSMTIDSLIAVSTGLGLSAATIMQLIDWKKET